jgi:hypothetical protein
MSRHAPSTLVDHTRLLCFDTARRAEMEVERRLLRNIDIAAYRPNHDNPSSSSATNLVATPHSSTKRDRPSFGVGIHAMAKRASTPLAAIDRLE